MNISNIEFKAQVNDLDALHTKFKTLNPIYKGLDHQIDTYFNAAQGRLKLREGTIENALIQYHRPNTTEAKHSEVILYSHEPNPALKAILIQQLGIKVIVDKQRHIYFLGHIKFHFDTVEGLGTFVEVEAINQENAFSLEQLKANCDYYQAFFDIHPSQLIHLSYSDLLLNK